MSIDPSEVEKATHGKYDVLSLIGEGGMGSVFLARHKELGSRVAIKILPADVRFSPDRLARFRREAALSAQLSHPNLVPAFEFNVESEIAYLIMPYIDGVTLDAYMEENGPLAYDDVKTLVTQVGSALTFAHNRGVVHRDIKPANILLEKATGRWLVTDFGVAHIAADTGLTRSGATVGTPAYMAPEQLGGAKDVDPRADLYSLAAVAFEALTGDRGEPTAGVEQLCETLKRRRPELDPQFARALTIPLATVRDQRPDTVQDWLAMLESRRHPKIRLGLGAAAAFAIAWAVWRIVVAPPLGPSAPLPVFVVLPFATTASGASELDSVLPQAITMQLQQLPNIRVLHPAEIQSRLRRQFGAGPHPLDSLLSAAQALGVEQALYGTAEASGTRFDLSIDVYDVPSKRRIGGSTESGPLDSLHVLVTNLVINAVAQRMASEGSGTPSPTLPSTWPAVQAFLRGDAAFKRGAFPEAIEDFNRVIALDPAYAMAYFKRMLATIMGIQPTKIGPAIRSALDAASRNRDGLDPTTARLLEGYEDLLRTGDVRAAETALDSMTREHPGAVDAWFLLGVLRFRLAAGLDATIPEAKFAFQQALASDPTFAPAIGQLLQISILENDRETTQQYMTRYVELDRTSVWSELMGVVDTLLFQRQHARTVLATFPTRPKRLLENIALATGELRQPPGTRAFGVAAIDALAARAETPAELAVTFRMRLATDLATGQTEAARLYLRAASGRGVPQEEIDRWVVLLAAVDGPALVDSAATRDAARRLLRAADEPFLASWLVARFARRTNATGVGEDRLGQLTPPPDDRTPIEQSLLDDLTALDQLAAGDTSGALATWRGATARYGVEDVLFGLANSLWPLRLDALRTAAAAGELEGALRTARTFERMAGFVDQVAWLPALTTTAQIAITLGDTNQTANAYADIRRLFGLAGPAGDARQDSITQLILQLRN